MVFKFDTCMFWMTRLNLRSNYLVRMEGETEISRLVFSLHVPLVRNTFWYKCVTNMMIKLSPVLGYQPFKMGGQRKWRNIAMHKFTYWLTELFYCCYCFFFYVAFHTKHNPHYSVCWQSQYMYIIFIYLSMRVISTNVI